MKEGGPKSSRHARAQAMLSMLSATGGKATNDQLEQAARNAEVRVTEKIGVASEKRFDQYALGLPIIKTTHKPGFLGDVFEGIDRWVNLCDGFHLPALPVQIKSSDQAVNIFKFGDQIEGSKHQFPNHGFTKLHGLMIVINCGPWSNSRTFSNQIRKEIGRIVKILEANPQLTDKLLAAAPKKLNT